MSSRKGSTTEAEYVHNLEKNGLIRSDVTFDEALKEWSKVGDFWVCSCDSPFAQFPPLKSGKKSVVQPYFAEILNKFNTIHTDQEHRLFRTLYRKDARTGQYTDKFHLPANDVYSVPMLQMENTPTIGSRKPDIPCYYLTANQLGVLRMVSFGECTPRSALAGAAFSPAEMGHVICAAEVLLERQPQRAFAIVGLSDGVRFQFFRVKREGESSEVVVSCMFMNMDGWAVRYAFDCFEDMH
jgi:hypothetical protein